MQFDIKSRERLATYFGGKIYMHVQWLIRDIFLNLGRSGNVNFIICNVTPYSEHARYVVCEPTNPCMTHESLYHWIHCLEQKRTAEILVSSDYVTYTWL